MNEVMRTYKVCSFLAKACAFFGCRQNACIGLLDHASCAQTIFAIAAVKFTFIPSYALLRLLAGASALSLQLSRLSPPLSETNGKMRPPGRRHQGRPTRLCTNWPTSGEEAASARCLVEPKSLGLRGRRLCSACRAFHRRALPGWLLLTSESGTQTKPAMDR